MRTIISQSIVLPASAESLFVMYTDPAKHAAITGAPVAINLEPGSPFQAFNGALTGATLQIIPQRLVIQSWRSTRFNDADPRFDLDPRLHPGRNKRTTRPRASRRANP